MQIPDVNYALELLLRFRPLKFMRYRILTPFLLLSSLATTCLAAAEPDKPVSFYGDIRPVFQANCVGCHQPSKDSGGYVMTDFARLFAGGDDGGAAIVPGKPDESNLLKAIVPGDDGKVSMPKKKDPLHQVEVALIKRWVAEGAVDDTPENVRQRYDEDHPPVYTMPPVITSLDFSPDGSLLAVAGFHEVLLHKADGSGLVARLIGLSERIESVRFSPDGSRLAVTGGLPGRMGEVQVWDVAKKKLKKGEEAPEKGQDAANPLFLRRFLFFSAAYLDPLSTTWRRELNARNFNLIGRPSLGYQIGFEDQLGVARAGTGLTQQDSRSRTTVSETASGLKLPLGVSVKTSFKRNFSKRSGSTQTRLRVEERTSFPDLTMNWGRANRLPLLRRYLNSAQVNERFQQIQDEPRRIPGRSKVRAVCGRRICYSAARIRIFPDHGPVNGGGGRRRQSARPAAPPRTSILSCRLPQTTVTWSRSS